MEKFETYRFDDVFYTKEEVEALGLSLFGLEELKKILDQQDQVLYQVTERNPILESTMDLETYLDNFDPDRKVWAKVNPGDPCHIVVIEFEFYYGIKHGDRVLLFSSESSRRDAYLEFNRLVDDKINQIMKENVSIVRINEKYETQETFRKNKMKLLNLFTEDKERKN